VSARNARLRAASQPTIHAIGDAAIRAALGVLEPLAATSPLMPRIEHVQMLHPDDRPRFAAAGIAASVQPVHLGSDALQAWKLWGDRAETEGYTWKSIADTGAVLPFGTDAPVEPYDPWPGLALAVRREDARWPTGTPVYAPEQSLTLDRALRANCVDPAVSAKETDRGRLTVGQRADVVVIAAASLDEPVTPKDRCRRPGRSWCYSTERSSSRPNRPGSGGSPRARERLGEQPVEDPRRRWEGVDRLGEDVDPDARLDRQYAFVDRRRCVRAGDGGADQLSRTTVDHDRDVAERRLDPIPPAALGERGDLLEGVDAGSRAPSSDIPTNAAFGIRIGRARQARGSRASGIRR
jgi:hypothetical protein